MVSFIQTTIKIAHSPWMISLLQELMAHNPYRLELQIKKKSKTSDPDNKRKIKKKAFQV